MVYYPLIANNVWSELGPEWPSRGHRGMIKSANWVKPLYMTLLLYLQSVSVTSALNYRKQHKRVGDCISGVPLLASVDVTSESQRDLIYSS